MTRPCIALFLGDPAGIGPEIVAKVIAEPAARQQACVLLIGDRAEAEQGMRYAGVQYPFKVVDALESFTRTDDDTPLFFHHRGSVSGSFVSGKTSM